MVFDSPLAATAFIESIRFICPCKANAPPPARVAQRASVAQTGYTAPQSSQMSAITAPSPAHPASRPTLKQAMSVASAPEDGPAPAIRRAGTTLPSFANLSDATSNWEIPPAPYYFAQAPHGQGQLVSASPAHSSGSGVGSVREDPAYGSSRPSSAVAHHSSSSTLR